ncbi:transmembrane alpha-helix domain-containing protein [Purpureocillium lavendulum]|uniref:Transmembrane alpha-helix domain-containing protein n=1 Tax=Purpureocillium lavendulum TaxID=1247861 RepID=A0AB34G6G0_9HYPO|nr:transmembrane alpha-helix domain-containing protein [Purpureocillium lavendulum]
MSPDMLLSAATSAGYAPITIPRRLPLLPPGSLADQPWLTHSRRTAAEPMMTTFAVAKQKRATRAKFAKVRTGCVTYDASSVSSTTFSGLAPSPPDISAELASAGFLDTQYPSPPYQPPYYPASAAATAAPSAVLDDAFWKQTMPRLVKESTAVRYANIAVHTLIFAKGPTIIHSADDGHHHHHNQYYQQQQHNHHHQSHHQHQHRRAVAGGRQHGPRTTADYYGRALTCYGLALSEARRTTDLREAILCAVFFVIFETINGDQAAAEAHLQSGQRILDELCSGSGGGGGVVILGMDGKTTTTTPPTKPKLRGMLRHVLQFLAVQARDFDRSDEIRHGIPLDEMPCEA